MELVSCNLYDALNSEVAATFLEDMCTPDLSY